MQDLQNSVEMYYAAGAAASTDPAARAAFVQFRDALTAGTARAAEKTNGVWQTNAWVKKGI
ncbi:MAG TPA: 2,3,4,5-tetrahydropyridine-2,6-dicarboxylate N-succinyltransferase, partial [Candidatus Angelobacter sp.]|nr:2,3,4,5-tetrahydropyridine-2,6-dicarboxylate N-succinyltransferase [Candidatus Angelobacter sp.]